MESGIYADLKWLPTMLPRSGSVGDSKKARHPVSPTFGGTIKFDYARVPVGCLVDFESVLLRVSSQTNDPLNRTGRRRSFFACEEEMTAPVSVVLTFGLR